jgi:hypothetical protein
VAGRSSPDASDLAWLVGVLWGPGAEIVAGHDRPAVGGTTYVIAPGRRRPRMLLPDDRGLARAALRGGAGTRSLAVGRGRAALAQALRADAAWRLIRDRVWVPGSDPLRRGLSNALGIEASFAAGLRARAPFRKPMLQVLGPSGEAIAYAKVAWNEVTALNVRSEHEALLAFAGLDDPGLRTPSVVALLEHRGFPVLVTRPMPEAVARLSRSDPPPSVSVTRRISEVLSEIRRPASIDDRLRSRLEAVAVAAPREGWAAAVVDAARHVREGIDTSALLAGSWHGAWAPWNLGSAGATLWVWDWEHWRPDVPVGLDVPHYIFQQRFVGARTPLDEAFAAAREGSTPALSSLGYERDARRALHATHVLEISLRYLEAQSYGAAANPRFVAGALDALRAVQA